MASDPFSVKDIVTIAALFLGPIAAVLITLWSQRRVNNRSPKSHLFMTLMANRKRWPPTIEWANALNLIDVVYADDADVIESWHKFYDVLCTPPFVWEKYVHAHIELLTAMAQSLGYRYLQQTDIDKYYAPSVLTEQAQAAQQVISEFLRVLKQVPPQQNQSVQPQSTPTSAERSGGS